MNNEAAGTVATEDKTEILLEVANLKKHFPVGRGLLAKPEILKAVDDVSFSVHRGETLSLVGESGCGKSTTGKVIIQLLKATSGSIKLEGTELTTLSRHDLRRLRKNVQMVFQDPYASLNPRWTVEQTLLEPMKAFQIGSKAERKERVAALLESVGLDPSSAKKYPHEFSGGQRQRIGIARALVLNPKLVIADEPVSALDISIQAQVLNLMQDVQQAFNLTYLFISHDLAVVEHISDRVAVMYLGRLVEIAGKRDLFSNPSHPYTEALLSASPRVDGSSSKKRIILVGDVPSPVNPPSGCAFRTRCWRAQEICKREAPELKDIGNRHQVACHFRATKVV